MYFISIFFLFFTYSFTFTWQISKHKLKEIFSQFGVLTDLQLKYTQDGVFRHFAFIGYNTPQEANEAQSALHQTYILNSKVKVETCKNLFDESARNKRRKTAQSQVDSAKEKKQKDASKVSKLSEEFEEMKNNPEFLEFLKVQRNLMKKAKLGKTMIA